MCLTRVRQATGAELPEEPSEVPLIGVRISNGNRQESRANLPPTKDHQDDFPEGKCGGPYFISFNFYHQTAVATPVDGVKESSPRSPRASCVPGDILLL